LSKLRITYRSSNKALGPYGKREVGTLRVEIDPKANGKWKTCVDTFEIKEGDGGHVSNTAFPPPLPTPASARLCL
jgi:hypothetical protein